MTATIRQDGDGTVHIELLAQSVEEQGLLALVEERAIAGIQYARSGGIMVFAVDEVDTVPHNTTVH